MAKISITDGLPYVSVTIETESQSLTLNKVLLDTGSAGTVFKTDDLERISIVPEPEDAIRRLTGIGGDEYVIEKTIARLNVGTLTAEQFTIQLAAMDYQLDIDGILGSDFLIAVKAQINYATLILQAEPT